MQYTHFSSLAVLIGLLWSTTGQIQARTTGDELDVAVLKVFSDKCVMCHDRRNTDAGGGVDFLLDLAALVDPDNYMFDVDDPSASRLFEIIDGPDAEMPKRRMKDVQWRGELSESELGTVKQWIERGGPSEAYLNANASSAKREVIDRESLLEAIALDIQSLTGHRLEYARYLTFTSLHNDQTVTNQELEQYREGAIKLLNSLSRSPDVLGMDTAPSAQRAVAVDEARTIFRFDLRDIGWDESDWEKIVGYYPYGLRPRQGFAKAVSQATASTTPFLRADWFVFAAAQPPLYHELLDIGPNLESVEQRLQIDRSRNIRQGRVLRAGFGKSGVSRNNRMVERHSAGSNGSYWISYDFGGNSGKQNLFDNPLGPPGILDTAFAFEHDGGEVIYTLPNDFQAYILVTASGRRLSVAPNSIVHDDSMMGGQIINGISCISCHYLGMKPENLAELRTLDKVRSNVEGAHAKFSLDELDLIRELYPDANRMSAMVRSDKARFLAAMRKAGITSNGANEPTRELFDRFARDLDVDSAAAGFGLSVERFRELMNRNESTRRILQRIENEGLQRQNYVGSYRTIAPALGFGEVMESQPLELPYFGGDPDSETPGQATAKPVTPFRKGGRLNVKMKAMGDKDVFYDGENIQCEIRTNEDCFVTIVSVDADGETTLLLPNSHHEQLKIEAGRRYVFPTPKMVKNGMELVVTPPYGETAMNVIATKRPLKLEGITSERLQQEGVISLGNDPRSTGLNGTSIEQNFNPNEWSTDRWTCKTSGR